MKQRPSAMKLCFVLLINLFRVPSEIHHFPLHRLLISTPPSNDTHYPYTHSPQLRPPDHPGPHPYRSFMSVSPSLGSNARESPMKGSRRAHLLSEPPFFTLSLFEDLLNRAVLLDIAEIRSDWIH